MRGLVICYVEQNIEMNNIELHFTRVVYPTAKQLIHLV